MRARKRHGREKILRVTKRLTLPLDWQGLFPSPSTRCHDPAATRRSPPAAEQQNQLRDAARPTSKRLIDATTRFLIATLLTLLYRAALRDFRRDLRAAPRTRFFVVLFRPTARRSRPMTDFITAATAASAAAVAAAVAALIATLCTRAALVFAAPTMERCVLRTKLLFAIDISGNADG